MSSDWSYLVSAWSLALVITACVGAPSPLDGTGESLIYGADDRRERFEVVEPTERDLFDSVAVLVPESLIDGSNVRLSDATTRAAANDLCPNQPFGTQPSVAFCSGVLVDVDLLLTAGHCLRLLALSDFAVVFGYAYAQPDELLPRALEVRRPLEIVSEAFDPLGMQPRLDYGWIRLDAPVTSLRRPAAVRVDPTQIGPDEPILFVGSAGGTPIKLDAGGAIRDGRERWFDYFTADTDSSHGSSGGGAFGEDGALLGILSRGQADFVATDAGCNDEARAPEDWVEGEEFGYAARALEGLCAADPANSLCRDACGDPCRALPRIASAPASCSIAVIGAGQPFQPSTSWLLGAAALGFLFGTRIYWRTHQCTKHESSQSRFARSYHWSLPLIARWRSQPKTRARRARD